ncbi:MAG: hydantoinase B/oxoprolinase family protein [Actinomycetes bacterium]
MSNPVVRDPATFEVFRNAISGLADQMAITVLRTAHSQIVAESMDFSAALCDAKGQLIAQANTIPVHLGSTPEAMKEIFEHFGSHIAPGDIYILNDPDMGGMHLPDLFVIEPIHEGQNLLGFSVAIANHADVGGWAAGSMAVQSTSIFAEGIQIPPSRLVDAGVINETLLKVIMRNCREPELFLGDLESQLSACHAGANGIRELAHRFGQQEYANLCAELLDYSETLLLSALAQVPPGEYAFEDAMDNDGLGHGPIPLVVKVTISATNAHFDFTGSSAQVASALNATSSFTRSGAYAALQGAVGRDIPPNAGFYRPITFTIPSGTILNPIRPAARGARGLTGLRVIDLVLGALSRAFPETVPAGGDGSPNTVAIGITEESGKSIVIWDILCGAWGARPDRDGLDAASSLGANLSNTPVEEMERAGLIRIDGYGYIPDTGGAGKFRGGLATFRDMTLLYGEATLRGRSDRRDFPPYGLHGGNNGSPSANILNFGEATQELLPTKPSIEVVAGTKHRHVTASGGGYGNPLERDPNLVLIDYREEKVSAAGALRDYGVVIKDGEVDQQETQVVRATRNKTDEQKGKVSR